MVRNASLRNGSSMASTTALGAIFSAAYTLPLFTIVMNVIGLVTADTIPYRLAYLKTYYDKVWGERLWV